MEVAAERTRQVEKLGWTEAHDSDYVKDELSLAAASYLLEETDKAWVTNGIWPWNKGFWNPTEKKRNIVKGMALALAELERLDREEN